MKLRPACLTRRWLRPSSSPLLLWLFFASPVGAVIYVDHDATGQNTGQSWKDAFPYLQDGLAAARIAREDVWVAEGTYRPDLGGTGTPGDRTAAFELISDVAIYGGFGGWETRLEQRDWSVRITVLSGDLPGSNSFHVVVAGDVAAGAILDGFTVTGGNANAPDGQNSGGGLYNSGSPSIRHCRFVDNDGQYGAGMFNFAGAPTLTDCSFVGNQATTSGGGLYNFHYSGQAPSATLIDCDFSNNLASAFGGAMRNFDAGPILVRCSFGSNLAVMSGGAIANGGTSRPALTECQLVGNGVQNFTGEAYGGGVSNLDDTELTMIDCLLAGNSAVGYPGYGGAIYSDGATVTLTGTQMSANHAAWGGAMSSNDSSVSIERCWFIANSASYVGGGLYTATSVLSITSSLLNGQVAGDDGGCMFHDLSRIELTGCTVTHNTAGRRGGGMWQYVGCETYVRGSIFWENADESGMLEPSQIYNTPSNFLYVGYSCIQGLTGAFGGVGNIGDPPQFVDADGSDNDPGNSDDDLRLTAASPCISSGDPAASFNPGVFDLDHHARVLCERVDRGAYEFGMGDFNCDRQVTLADFESWSECMSGPGASGYGEGCEALDWDLDEDIDLVDFAGFMRAWEAS